MSNKLVFTKYLYSKDEVELSLLESILQNKNFSEVYFWVRELYDSNDPEELWQFIFKIYYDFYFLNNRKFASKIIKYYEKWLSNHNIDYVIYIVYNMCRQTKNRDFNIFIYRTYYSSIIEYVLNSINFNTHKGVNKYFKLLNYFIVNKNNELISFYLKKCCKFENINEFLTTEFSINIVKNDHYNNKFHLLLCSCLNFPKTTSSKFIYKKVPIDAYMDVKKKLDEDLNIPNYKILKMKRLYKISDKIGCFSLVRSNYVLNKEFWYKWEFHAYKSKIWKTRFDKYKIKIEPRKKLLTFLDEDEMKNFIVIGL